jgi:hypothetical protein
VFVTGLSKSGSCDSTKSCNVGASLLMNYVFMRFEVLSCFQGYFLNFSKWVYFFDYKLILQGCWADIVVQFWDL